MDHSHFDQRRYPVVPVREGYGEWARTYEDTVQDEMDVRLLERVATVDWAGAGRVLDLACGTGRIGAWLRARGVASLDGVDVTPEMLAKAEARGVYRRLGAAYRAGWALVELDEGVVDDAWVAKKPKWERYRFHPVSFVMVWRKRG